MNSVLNSRVNLVLVRAVGRVGLSQEESGDHGIEKITAARNPPYHAQGNNRKTGARIAGEPCERNALL